MIGFGSRLRAAMDAKGWTAYRLSKESGVSQQHIGRLLRGQRAIEGAAQDTVRRLVDALEVRADWLVKGEGQPHADRPGRLRERVEWSEVTDAVHADHPELDAADLRNVGDVVDDHAVFAARLDTALVYGLALAIREWRRRATRTV